MADEFAALGRQASIPQESYSPNDPWDPRNYSIAFCDSVYEPEEVNSPRSPEPAQDAAPRPDHQRTTSELKSAGAQSVLIPLLAHTRGESRSDDLAEFGLSSTAGVGTAARGNKIDTGFRHSSVGSVDRAVSCSPSSPRRASLSPRGPRSDSHRSKTDFLSSKNDIGHGPWYSSSYLLPTYVYIYLVHIYIP